MKHMLRLRKYHCFLGINIPFLYNDGLRAALAQSLTCSWKQHRSVWRAWGDRRACAPHVRNEQPQRKAGPSLDISTVTTSHSSRARTREGGPALYEPGRLATLPADSRLRRRSHSLLRSSPQNRRQKSSLYRRLTAFPSLHFPSGHLVPDADGALCVVVVPSFLPRALLLLPVLPELLRQTESMALIVSHWGEYVPVSAPSHQTLLPWRPSG